MFYTYKDTKLYYDILGVGQPVLLIHGLSCDMQLMKGCMEPIFEKTKGYQRIYIDLPGMGSSTASIHNATSDSILEIVMQFIKDTIKDKFLLIGESYGGYVSIGLMGKMEQRIKSTILICPMVQPEHNKRILPEKDIVAYDIEFLATLEEEERENFCQHAIVANKKTYDRYMNEVVSGLKKADTKFISNLSANYAFTFDIEELLITNQCQIPTLFLAGKQDICVGYQDLYTMLAVLPRSSFYLVDKAGHNLQIDQPELFNTIVNNWLVTLK